MGADGHIAIWRKDEVWEAFPDFDELARAMGLNVYCHELDGVEYYHGYSEYGAGRAFPNWDEKFSDKDLWFKEDDELTEEEKRQMRLKNWISSHSTHWEVWT